MGRPRRRDLLLCAGIVVVVVAAFAPALENGFAWDDDANIVKNQRFRGLSSAHLRWMFTTTHMGHYQPLSWISLAVDHAMWGLNPKGYHLTSVLIHLLNALLLFVLARSLLGLPGSRPAGRAPPPGTPAVQIGAAVAAVLFAVHPMRVESVAWVTERRDVVAAAFYLLGLLAYVRAATKRRRWLWLSLSLVAFGASLLSKAWVITLPAVLLVLDVYPLRRRQSLSPTREGERGRPEPLSLSQLLVEKIPFAVLGASAGLMALHAQDGGHALTSGSNLGVAHRLLQAGYGACFYLLKSIWPTDLSPLYLLRAGELADTTHLVALAAVVCITAVLLWRARRWPWLASAWLCYLLIVAPVLGFAQSGLQAVADRYTYLSLWPWSILAGAGMVRVLSVHARSVTRRRMLSAALALAMGSLIVLLAAATREQTRHWRSSDALFGRAIQVDPLNYVAYSSRGAGRHAAGRLGAAHQDLDRAITIAPSFAMAYANRGLVLLERGELEAAGKDFAVGAQLDPRNGAAWCGLAMIRHRQGLSAVAREAYDRGLRLGPTNASCYTNRGILHHQQRRASAALSDHDTALRLDPELVAAYVNRAGLRAERNDLVGAIDDYTQAIALAPHEARAYAARGSARQRKGDLAGAIGDYSKSLRRSPRQPLPLLRRGLAYMQLGQPARAVKDLTEALRHAPPSWRQRRRAEAMLNHARQSVRNDSRGAGGN